MCQVWCSGIQGIYAQLLGVSICHGYMCIVLYMKLIWCNGFAEISASLEEGVGSICHGYMCIVLYMNLFGVMVFQTSMLDWGGEGVGCICHRYMCIVLYMCQ